MNVRKGFAFPLILNFTLGYAPKSYAKLKSVSGGAQPTDFWVFNGRAEPIRTFIRQSREIQTASSLFEDRSFY
jgi:hypothetical protein